MVDVGYGWHTDRLEVEPLRADHAAELAPALDDPAVHEFIGGAPLTLAALTDRYAWLQRRRSPDGRQLWGNWVLRVQETGEAVGTVQATLPAAGPGAGPAEVAWVIAPAAQGRGYATEAAASLVRGLRADGWTVVAHVHPDHVASQRVAGRAGLEPTDEVVDGEVRWIGRAAAERATGSAPGRTSRSG